MLPTSTLATALVLLLSAAAFAQVATLRSPDPDTEAPVAPVEQLEGQDAILAFAACMRDNGIEMDDPQFGLGGGFFGRGPGGDVPPRDINSETFQAAMESCGPLLESLRPELDPEQAAEQNETLIDFAECMRTEGIDFPDPVPGQDFGFAIRSGDSEIDPFSDEFQTASTACQDNLDFELRGPAQPAN